MRRARAGRAPARRRRARRRMAPRARRGAGRARDGRRGALASSRAILDDGIGALRTSLWVASLVYLADACAVLGDVDAAEALYPELAAHAGTNVMVGHLVACYGAIDRYLGDGRAARGLGSRGVALRVGARAQHEARRAHLARAHRLRVRAHAARAGRGRRPPARAGAARRRARPRAGDRAPDLARRADGARRRRRRSPSALPDGLTGARARHPRRARAGLARTARSAARSTSASTRPRTTSARSSARRSCANRTEAAGYAHRGAVSCRTERSTIRECRSTSSSAAFAEQLELTSDDVRLIDEINDDEGVSWLFSFISADKPAHVLPLRGTVAGRDRRGRAPGERPGRRDRRGEQVRAGRVVGRLRLARQAIRGRFPAGWSPSAAQADPWARRRLRRRACGSDREMCTEASARQAGVRGADARRLIPASSGQIPAGVELRRRTRDATPACRLVDFAACPGTS